MNRRRPIHFRNSLDLRDKVQVRVLRKRLRLSDEEFSDIVRKSGNSISAITKEATRAKIQQVEARGCVRIDDIRLDAPGT